MKAITKNTKYPSLKLIHEYQKYQNLSSKIINNFRIKTNYHFFKENKLKSESLKNIINPNIIEQSLEKSNNSQNHNIIKYSTEKLLRVDKNLFEEKEKRQISFNNHLNLSQKLFNIKLSLSKGKNKTLSLYSLDDLSNNYLLKNRINFENTKEKSEESTIKNEKEINSDNYFKTKKLNTNINDSKEKSFKILTEENSKEINRKLFKSLFLKCKSSISRNENNNNKISTKNKSYDDSKKLIQKIKSIKEKINNLAPYTYIKVNKNSINKTKTIDTNTKQKNFDNINYNNQNNNNKTIIVQKLNNNKSQIIINSKNKNAHKKIDRQNKLIKKTSKTFFYANNNNIFLDKTYQNRFNQRPKNNKFLPNEIFTSERQKEYNTIVVKKRNNYLNSIVTISTTNSSNSSNYNNNSNICKNNWVHRLYDEEIKKQKKRDKLIYSLRKSILSEKTKNKPKKEIYKTDTLKEFNYNYTNNFGNDFNIINFFLSDDKKNKKKNKNKMIKKYKRKNYAYDYDYNNKIEEENNNNNNEEKDNKMTDNKRRPMCKYKKSMKNFLNMYKEELINEEDEEKERDEDEK